MDIHTDGYLDLKALSAYSTMGVSTLRHHLRVNGLPSFKVPGKGGKTGKILVKRSEFDDWIEQFRSNDCIDPDAVANDVLDSLN